MLIKAVFLCFTCAAVVERILQTFPHGSTESRRVYFKNSFYVLLLIYLLCVALSVTEVLLIGREPKFWISAIGSILFLIGMELRNSAIRSLGKQWSVHIDLKKTQQIVRSGPYRYIRHPYYFSVLLELIGFALIANAYFSLALVLCFQLPLILWRIGYEEKALERKFGRAYVWYRKKLGSLPL